MKARNHPILFLACISILLAFHQKLCLGTIRNLRQEHEKIMIQAREQISVKPEIEGVIRRPRLPNGLTIQPEESPNRRVRVLEQEIDGLLVEAPTEPNRIAALQKKLDEFAEQENSGLERSLYRSLSEKLGIARAYAEAIDKQRDSYESRLEKLDGIYDATANAGQTAETWFSASFIANIVVILGLVTRIGNISSGKLDRQLKQLQIVEKTAQLEEKGIRLD